MIARAFLERLRIGQVDTEREPLYEFRRVLGVPVPAQVALVAGLFVATVLCTWNEYRTHGTSFGVAGPAFNVLICPIYEELIFRGWILTRLVRRTSNATAILVSALLFGLLHLRNIYWLDGPTLARTMAYSGLVLGPLFAYVALRLRTLWPAVVLHYLNNLLYFVR